MEKSRLDKVIAIEFLGIEYTEEFSPTTKIEHTWMVIEKLRTLGVVDIYDQQEDGWHMEISSKKDGVPMTYVEGETLGIAACLAVINLVIPNEDVVVPFRKK